MLGRMARLSLGHVAARLWLVSVAIRRSDRPLQCVPRVSVSALVVVSSLMWGVRVLIVYCRVCRRLK